MARGGGQKKSGGNGTMSQTANTTTMIDEMELDHDFDDVECLIVNEESRPLLLENSLPAFRKQDINRPTHPRLLIIIATVEAFFLSGVIFGWAPLQVLLSSEGQYSEHCQVPSPNGGSCSEQDARFVFIYTAASSCFSLFVWPMGAMLDKIGPRYACMIGSGFVCIGSVMFSLSDSQHLDIFSVAYSVMGVGGPAVVFSFMHLSNLFPNNRAAIIALFNVMIDASALVFVFFNVLHEKLNLSHKILFFAYGIIAGLVCVTSPLLWPNQPYQPIEYNSSNNSLGIGEPSPLKRNNNNRSSSTRRSLDRSEVFSPSPYTSSSDLSTLAFSQQLSTPAFWISAILTSLQLLRVNFYLATLDYQLSSQYPTNPRGVSIVTDLFGWILPLGGVVSVPLIGYLLDSHGLTISAMALAACGAVFGGLVLVPNLYAQIATFAVFALFRAFLFSAMSAFVAVLFGFTNFGKLWGIVFALSGILSAGSMVLSTEVDSRLQGNYFWPNVGMAVLGVSLFVLPVWLYQRSQRAKRIPTRSLN